MTRKDAKKWAGDVLVARTEPKESLNDDSGETYWWKEWRVRPLTHAEFADFAAAGKVGQFDLYKPFLIESRRVDGRADRTPTNPWPWNLWMLGDSPADAVREMMGDSSFAAAESLVAEHAVLARYHAELKAAVDAEYAAANDNAAAYGSLRSFKDRHNAEYQKKIAGKDADAVNKIEVRTMNRLKPQLDALRTDASNADARYQSAKAELKAVRARKPKLADYPDLAAKFPA